MTPAIGPAVTAPYTAVAKMRKTTAVVELHPEKAKPTTKRPFTIIEMNPANLRTFVRLHESFDNNESL